jgi:threonine/homoserine/homoserine lactone efflux protein
MSASSIVGFALASFLIIVVPGPSVLFVVSRGVTLGRRAALATVVGNTTGALLLSWMVAFGLGPIVTRSIAVFTTVKLIGAAYLIVLGTKMWRSRRTLAVPLDGDRTPISARRILRDGLVVGVTNPKVVVFFAAVLPQFVEPDAGPASLQMAGFGLVFAVIAFLADSTWGLAAGSLRSLFVERPERMAALGGVGGIAVMGLGARLAIMGRH